MPRQPRTRNPAPGTKNHLEGWFGWDDYADFYDWENAQTLDRRDVRFWQDMAARAEGAVLELGCGTGRVTLPVARSGARIVGVDRSAEMLGYARRRAGRAKYRKNVALVRSDIRSLPFRKSTRFDLVMAPYGILQSLIRESDLRATLASVAAVLSRRGVYGLDLVPDLPVWKEYENQVRFRGRRPGTGSRITKRRPDDFPSAVHRDARTGARGPRFFAGLSHNFDSSNDRAAGARGVSRHRSPGRLRRRALGSARGRVADPRPKALRCLKPEV